MEREDGRGKPVREPMACGPRADSPLREGAPRTRRLLRTIREAVPVRTEQLHDDQTVGDSLE